MEKLKKTIRNNFGIVAIILIVGIILFLLPGQNLFPKELDISTDINKDINKNLSIEDNRTITANITDEDKNFKNWIYLSFRPIIDDINCVSKAAKKQNFSETELCGRFLRENSNISLRQIDGYSISSSLEEARSEYKKSLEYFNLGGLNLEIGARNRDPKQMYNATIYIQIGTVNMERVTVLLGNDTKIPFAKTG